MKIFRLLLLAGLIAGCAAQTTTIAEQKPAGPPPGPTIELGQRPLAVLVYWLEQMSRWSQSFSAAWSRAFDERFGLEGPQKELLRKLAFARLDLAKKEQQGRAAPSFEDPFGPEGLFSPARTIADEYWHQIAATAKPADLPTAFSRLLPAEDAQLFGRAASALAPQIMELALPDKETGDALAKLFSRPETGSALLELASFLEVEARGVRFEVLPLRTPSQVPVFAEAFGDLIFLGLAEGEPPGQQHLLLVAHEAARRLFSRIGAAKKAALTRSFAEAAGHRSGYFVLEEGLLDAFSHGILPVRLSLQEPPEPVGDKRRQQVAAALRSILEGALAQRKPFDGKFALEAAAAAVAAAPPHPADFIDGAMVFGSESAIEAFRTAVVRWMVWKFPLEKKYNYRKKFDDQPGRSVLCILSPKDLKQLFALTETIEPLKQALKQAAVYLQRGQGVIVAQPRELRGYVFVVAAPSPEKMKSIAQAFFALKEIPREPVIVE